MSRLWCVRRIRPVRGDGPIQRKSAFWLRTTSALALLAAAFVVPVPISGAWASECLLDTHARASFGL
jgi:hypothetical protein